MKLAMLNDNAAVARVLKLMPMVGRSGRERAVADWIGRELIKAGASAKAIATDPVHKRSPYLNGAGNCGNLVFKMPGTMAGPRRLLAAHLDTVPLCEGSQPIRKGTRIVSGNRATALGADDRAGCSVILTAALEIMRRRLPHPPLTFLWSVQEEVGMYGVRFASLAALGRPRLAFNWDGCAPHRAVVGATGACGMDITVCGKAVHAGNSPEQGVSAAVILGLAISDLTRHGWHGLVVKNGVRGTSNIGVIRGGEATNVVMDCLEAHAEIRAHDPALRRRIVAAYRQAFSRAAKRVKNAAGMSGQATCKLWDKYEAFVLSADEPCVLEVERAVRAEGLAFERVVSNAGLDANWLTARGVPTVTLGAGGSGAHAVGESLDVNQYLTACRIALRLATSHGLPEREPIRSAPSCRRAGTAASSSSVIGKNAMSIRGES